MGEWVGVLDRCCVGVCLKFGTENGFLCFVCHGRFNGDEGVC